MYTEQGKAEFIEAIEDNNYEKLEIEENLVLVTEIEPNDSFEPFVLVENESFNERDVEEALMEVDFLDWESVEIQDGNSRLSFSFCEIYGSEFINPTGGH